MAPGLNGKSWEPRGSVVHRDQKVKQVHAVRQVHRGQEGIQVNAGRQVYRGQEGIQVNAARHVRRDSRGSQRASEVFIPWGLMFWGS
ncbi:hypothetical protein BJP17_23865 [Escherichia coli]|nr:hypothetical protein BJP17_23865 [Escherichia coli]